MARILKVLGIVIGALVLLFAGVLVVVSLVVDPNDYKDQITAAVDNATGRELTLEGDLGLRLFPRLGIAVGAAELSNAEGFGAEPFARIEGAELSVGLFPLLFRRVEIDRASLEGLRLNLARNAAGQTNWEDLAEPGEAPQTVGVPVTDGSGPSVDISVAAVRVSDAEVVWRDAVTGDDWQLSRFNLEADDFDLSRSFPLSIGFELAGVDIDATIEAKMRAQLALAENRYRLDDLSIDIAGSGSGWPGGSGEASLGFDSFVADLDDQSLELDGLDLEMLGMEVGGNLVGSSLLDDLHLDGSIEIGDFDPRDVMDVFGASIETADTGVLRSASARAEFYFTAAAMGMRDLTLRLDDSSLTGSAGLRGDRLEFDLTVDAINIDRYLPPGADGASASADEGSVDEIDLPIDPLRNFVADGSLALNEAQFLGLTLTNANFALTANNGRMSVVPTAALYGGTLEGNLAIAVQGDSQARLSLMADLGGVDMGGIGRDYLKIDTLAGTGSVHLDLAAVGAKVGDIKRGLDGTASVAITDGALLGIDVWQEVMELRARLTGPDAPPAAAEPRTAFERIAVGGPVEDGVLTTQEFAAVLPFASLSGQGTIDLLTTELDLNARAGLVDGPTLEQDPVLSGLAGRQLPLRITGTLAAPRVLPDVGALLSARVQEQTERVQQEAQEGVERAQQEAQQQVDEARDDARDRVQQQLEEQRQSLRDRIRD